MLRHTEFDEALSIDVSSRANRVDPSKCRPQQRPDPSIAGKGAVGETPRYDHDRNIVPVASGDPARPEFCLDQNRERWTTASDRRFDAPWMIQRGQARGHLRSVSSKNISASKRRGGCAHGVPVVFEDANEPACGEGLADARGVDPDPLDIIRGDSPKPFAQPAS